MNMDFRKTQYGRLWSIVWREICTFAHRPLLLFTMLVAPVACMVLFLSIMSDGLPTSLPAAVVDEDNTATSRAVVRTLDAMQATNLVASYPDFASARRAMLRGEIYGFFHIPKGVTEKAIAGRQPHIAFYTNDCYYMPAALLMKDMKLSSELVGLAITRESLYGHGLTPRAAMGVVQPVVVETHPLNNPELNYSAYLNNIIIPGILFLLIMITTAYTIGIEWKNGTQRELYAMSGYSSTVALVGKLLPQTLVFSLMVVFFDVCFYRYCLFPCNCGIVSMMLLGIVTVMASQGLAVFMMGLFAGQMRMAMSACSLWGIVAMSITGFTFPVTAMDAPLQWLSWLFPLRHYYVIYVNQALNGYPVWYVWQHAVALLAFMLLPLTVLWRYRVAFLKIKYVP